MDIQKESLAEGIDIHLGDFREWLPYAVDDFHHMITDPPYEQRSHNTTGSIRRADGKANPEAIPFEGIDLMRDDLIVRAKMKCSGWMLCFCTTEGVAIWRDNIEARGLKYKTPLIWVKPDALPKFNGQGPSHGHECLVSAWCGTGYSRWNGGGRRGTFIHNVNPPSRDGRHPTEKPLSLMIELVTLFSNPGEIICDPFMGSGTTGIACVKTGRRFIGIERDVKYFQIARERILGALAQGDLFVKAPKPIQEKLIFDADSKTGT
jgi:site-specific DNA-methyltransferase (adenine-specific)